MTESGAGALDFVLTIADVFQLPGRGTVVVGPIESGALHDGDVVEVRDGVRPVLAARATIELICSRTADPRSIALVLGAVDAGLLASGQTVVRRAAVR